ncbi:hypothetical protein AM587_10004841 [Phytophthora nicotianae]|uniref:Uncharacterized protein n=1 Tax=Phytophthora nicotianae TaxID=4792 RepID=A0A0W8DZW8_PHYNI|nr:hypothetical protein AM587_10004841 [Phytophthora nicotianae]
MGFESWSDLEVFLKQYEAETYQIHACVQVVDPSGLKFALKLTSVQLEHNHPLAKHTYNLYPQTRMAYEPDVLAMVDELRKVGAKKKIILAYIHDHSVCKPTRKDVHNLVDKLKKEAHSAPTRAKRLKRWMIEFTEEPGNIGRIFVDKIYGQVDVLALAGKEVITDEVMHKILTKLLGFKPNIAIFDSSTLGIVVDGSVSTSNEIIREALAGVTNEKVLIPVNCNGNQWCAIIMYLAGGVVHVYDSSSSSYLVSVRAVAQKIVLLPPHVQKKQFECEHLRRDSEFRVTATTAESTT